MSCVYMCVHPFPFLTISTADVSPVIYESEREQDEEKRAYYV